jgi:putative peptidoglycan lipid II flippase
MRTATLVAGNLVGKLLGLGREVTLALLFGAGAAADAFKISLAAALIPTHFLVADILDGSFVPLYVRFRRDQPGSATRLIRLVLSYLTAVSIVAIVVLWIAGPTVIRILAPGLSAETTELAARMLRWMSLGIPFYCLAALVSLHGVCVGRFGPRALRTVFQNTALIITIIAAARLRDPQWIALGFVVAFMAYAGWMVLHLRFWRAARGETGRSESRSELQSLLRAAAPLVPLMMVGQTLAIVERAASSFVGGGAIASLEYARVLVETPHALVGFAAATVALSHFASLSPAEVRAHTESRILPLATLVAGAMAVLAVSAPEIVRLLYYRGEFDDRALNGVTNAVRGLAIGGAFMTTTHVMQRILTARLRAAEVRAPMLIGLLTAVVGNILLVPRLGLMGVGLASSFAYILMSLGLARKLGVLGQLVARVPGWTVAAGAAFAVRSILPQVPEAPLVRATAIVGVAGAMALMGLSLFPNTRRDVIHLGAYGRAILARLSLAARRRS